MLEREFRDGQCHLHLMTRIILHIGGNIDASGRCSPAACHTNQLIGVVLHK